jgi:hypothetical protein
VARDQIVKELPSLCRIEFIGHQCLRIPRAGFCHERQLIAARQWRREPRTVAAMSQRNQLGLQAVPRDAGRSVFVPAVVRDHHQQRPDGG